MKRLHRGPAPGILKGLKVGTHKWGTVPKQQIRDCLEAMQGPLCAYCEGTRGAQPHIEHLWSRDAYSQRTFDWTNLFFSCSREDSCGRFKDHKAKAFYPGDLLDPCSDDPDEFFHFISDGHIDLRAGLTTNQQHRARETLRVFNLNLDHHGSGRSLCAERRRVLEAYRSRDTGILEELETWPETDRRLYIDKEVAETRHQPFSSMIRHFFQ